MNRPADWNMTWVAGLAVLAAAASVVLMGMRVAGAISFAEPLHVVTSGWEQENLLAIWLGIHDRPIYASRFEIPYRWAVYNWLFYVGYGTVADAVLRALALQDAWLPTVTRLITLAALPAGVAGAYLAYARLIGPAQGAWRWLYGGSAVFLVGGPLVGFWGMTTRPDVWAVVLEIWAVAAFCILYRRRPVVSVIVFCLLAYGAWALKQSHVNALGAVGLFLLVRRDWRPLGLLMAVTLAAWGTTLTLGSEAFLRSILLLEHQTQIIAEPGLSAGWTASHAVRVAAKAAVKTIPFLAGTAMTAVALALRPEWRRRLAADDGAVIAAGGAVTALLIAVPTSFQPGSADNYYFASAFFLSVLALWGLRHSGAVPAWRGWFFRALTAGWALQGAAIAAVIFGLTGVVSVASTHERMKQAKACADALPRPLYAADMYLSLPWMTPGTPPFVLAFGYFKDRARGQEFERGGVGALIEDGFFEALILPSDTKGQFDGGKLTKYRRVKQSCARYKIYLKINSAGQ